MAREDRPERVTLLGPNGVDVPLRPVTADRVVTTDGVDWTPGYAGTITDAGRYRVEATGGRAAIRGPEQPRTDAVRRNGIVLPIVLATAGATAAILLTATILGLRALDRRRVTAG